MATVYRDSTPLTDAQKASLEALATAIRTKMYGKDVRDAIAAAIEMVGMPGVTSYFTPKGVKDNLAALKTEFPNGTDGIYITKDDGYWCFWDGSSWQKGNVYQAPILPDDLKYPVSGLEVNDPNGTYPDLDYLPTNSIIMYASGFGSILHSPTSLNVGATVLTYSYIKSTDASMLGGAVQIATLQAGAQFKRIAWGSTATWSDWEQMTGSLKADAFINASTSEAPYNNLDTLKDNTIVTYSDKSATAHFPESVTGSGFTVVTIANSDSAKSQFLYESNGNFYIRNKWGNSNYSAWFQLNFDLAKVVKSQPMQFPATTERITDFDTVSDNTAITFASLTNILHTPDPTDNTGATLITQTGEFGYPVQICAYYNGRIFSRVKWGSTPVYTPWHELTHNPKDISLSIFSKVGVIGDSYASGELWSKEGSDGGSGSDHYDLSWLQIIARKNGLAGTNFSKGGLTTRSWLTDDKGLALLNSSDAQDIILISLGINDTLSLGSSYLGTVADIESGADTFYGNYGKIVKAVQAKSSATKIVLINLARTDGDFATFNAAIADIASHFGVPLIKQQNDWLFSDDLYLNHMVGGHPRAVVYAAMAEAFERLLKQCVVDNYDYFSDLGL